MVKGTMSLWRNISSLLMPISPHNLFSTGYVLDGEGFVFGVGYLSRNMWTQTSSLLWVIA